ncbi:MAG: fibrobacter succinogenes major paralogous domain-containing protein [Prolixibacteraceae bacterium]|nr:fibrobacter succinogenes major paralogous domain-containing protein [Prolixibacteraceae bacterium]
MKKLIYSLIFLTVLFSCKKDDVQYYEEQDPVTDIDGNVYETVKIGDQIWMAENLRVTKYRNGDALKNITDGKEWCSTSGGRYCSYNNDESLIPEYGLLYSLSAVTDIRNIAPEGWHIATDTEWETLKDYIISFPKRYGDLSKALSAKYGWKESNDRFPCSPGYDMESNNSSGFSAVGGGIRNGSSHTGSFEYFNIWGCWYSIRDGQYKNQGYWFMLSSKNYLLRYEYWEVNGFYVRCVKDL